MIVNIKRARPLADVIEVRFDCLRLDQFESLRSQISDLKFERPLLATFRSADEGGRSTATFDERSGFWQRIGADFWAIDLERDIVGIANGSANSIVSFHDIDGVPSNIGEIYKELISHNGDLVKVAATASDIVDTIPVWGLLERARSEGRQIIPISMGEAGKWTRILGLAYGAFMTYASLDTGRETADGQITAKDLIEIYRVKELDRETKVYGVIGDPVSESLSPYMHNPAFAAAAINAVFVPLMVKDLDEFMQRMVKPTTREVELNLAGFSVTMPHKQTIIKHLDAMDTTAEKIGAVNTVKIEDGKLTGHNTDAHGFITTLKERSGDLRDARVAVFGAGGAARACVYALKLENADVTVFARDQQKAEAFARNFDVKYSVISKAKDQTPKPDLSTFDIIVNATPAGMKGAQENAALLTADHLNGVKFVYDLVTTAGATPLMREAKKAGVPAMGGIKMLIAQGARQFEIWTGSRVPVDILRESVSSTIQGR